MDQLIPITTDQHGESVVSARLLYSFLDVKTEFAKWCKRMFGYGFYEGQKYVQVFVKNDENPTNGRPLTDYALTLDCAKQIAMLQRSEKGKAARQYFINCEKALRQLLAQSSSLSEQRLASLEQKLNQVLITQQQATLALLEVPRSIEPVPVETTRMKIQRVVNAYCRAKGVGQQEIWRIIYDRLYYAYRVSIRQYKRRSERESWLDVAERHGHLDKLYAIVSAELTISG